MLCFFPHGINRNRNTHSKKSNHFAFEFLITQFLKVNCLCVDFFFWWFHFVFIYIYRINIGIFFFHLVAFHTQLTSKIGAQTHWCHFCHPVDFIKPVIFRLILPLKWQSIWLKLQETKNKYYYYDFRRRCGCHRSLLLWLCRQLNSTFIYKVYHGSMKSCIIIMSS